MNTEKIKLEEQQEQLDIAGVMPSLPLDKILRLDQPYSLPEVLKGLIEAADILLHKKDYDGHGWERLEYCYRHAKDIVAEFGGNEA